MTKVGEHQSLERVDLVLQRHEIRDCFIPTIKLAFLKNMDWINQPFIRIVDGFQTDVLFVLEQAFQVR